MKESSKVIQRLGKRRGQYRRVAVSSLFSSVINPHISGIDFTDAMISES